MKIFFTILAIGLVSSLLPLGYYSVVFGAPAVILNTIILSLVFKKELYGI